ncbi:MAG: hypothetical protein JWO87_3433 [Phycisphaerales bacterium]|nr:hypothetical protein [Phycisphaerales bacterium]
MTFAWQNPIAPGSPPTTRRATNPEGGGANGSGIGPTKRHVAAPMAASAADAMAVSSIARAQSERGIGSRE